jgi:hypothetical protein
MVKKQPCTLLQETTSYFYCTSAMYHHIEANTVLNALQLEALKELQYEKCVCINVVVLLRENRDMTKIMYLSYLYKILPPR